MDIDKGKARKLEMDELEQVSGGRITDFFQEGRLASLFSGGDETPATDSAPQPNVQSKPLVFKA